MRSIIIQEWCQVEEAVQSGMDLGKRSIHSFIHVCQSEYSSVYVTPILLVAQFVSFMWSIIISSNYFKFSSNPYTLRKWCHGSLTSSFSMLKASFVAVMLCVGNMLSWCYILLHRVRMNSFWQINKWAIAFSLNLGMMLRPLISMKVYELQNKSNFKKNCC